MNTRTPQPTTRVLGWIAILLTVVICLLVILCLPRFHDAHLREDDPALGITAQTADAVTELPTEPPTEPEPTLPPPEPNPYGPLDFQFDGWYLKCLRCESKVGVDVSGYQGEIDWQQVKDSGVDYAMVRLAYRGYESGTIQADSFAEANLQGASAVGLPVGVYFFSQAITPEEAVEEAEYVLETIAPYDVTMPIVFDWEFITGAETARTNGLDKKALTACAGAFLERIREAGYWPMLYFNTFQSRNNIDISALKEYDFWLALYSYRMRFPYRIKMWQYTCEGYVPGIEGAADLNILFMDETGEP